MREERKIIQDGTLKVIVSNDNVVHYNRGDWNTVYSNIIEGLFYLQVKYQGRTVGEFVNASYYIVKEQK